MARSTATRGRLHGRVSRLPPPPPVVPGRPVHPGRRAALPAPVGGTSAGGVPRVPVVPTPPVRAAPGRAPVTEGAARPGGRRGAPPPPAPRGERGPVRWWSWHAGGAFAGPARRRRSPTRLGRGTARAPFRPVPGHPPAGPPGARPPPPGGRHPPGRARVGDRAPTRLPPRLGSPVRCGGAAPPLAVRTTVAPGRLMDPRSRAPRGAPAPGRRLTGPAGASRPRPGT